MEVPRIGIELELKAPEIEIKNTYIAKEPWRAAEGSHRPTSADVSRMAGQMELREPLADSDELDEACDEFSGVSE